MRLIHASIRIQLVSSVLPARGYPWSLVLARHMTSSIKAVKEDITALASQTWLIAWIVAALLPARRVSCLEVIEAIQFE